MKITSTIKWALAGLLAGNVARAAEQAPAKVT